MSYFNEYIQPMSTWLHQHPHWALFITFIISFSESLAIIGSIVPGSVTMTAVGILAGSGVMRIDLTLLSATLGAIAGDSASYFLGYYYREKLTYIWPFKKHPHWLQMGKNYFSHHGGKSVLIGRFIGPLRAIIPVIAGMMHMSQWRFFLANAVSAIGWSILYVMPGVLIGAASNELSPENATKLFVYILLLLILIWLLTLGLKWILIRANRVLLKNLHEFWLWSKRHPFMSKFFFMFTPGKETKHYYTAALVINALLASTWLVVFTVLIYHNNYVQVINQPIHLLVQSLRTDYLDTVFIYFSQLSSLQVIAAFCLILVAHAIYRRNLRFALYIISLFITAIITSKFLSWLIYKPRPPGILIVKTSSSYPCIRLSVATSVLFFIFLYKNSLAPFILTKISKHALIIILFLSAAAELYLGNNWFIDILTSVSLGLSIAIFFWIFYRKSFYRETQATLGFAMEPVLLIILASIGFSMNYQQIRHQHQIWQKPVIITEAQWWGQTMPILPLYHRNRVGHLETVFNIQYEGSINKLKQQLINNGWQLSQISIMSNILNHMSADAREKALPLLPHLHNNQRPVLLMTYTSEQTDEMYVIRLWKSNYYISNQQDALWIGAIHLNRSIKLIERKPRVVQLENNENIDLLLKAINKKFKYRIIDMKDHHEDIFSKKINYKVMLIREK